MTASPCDSLQTAKRAIYRSNDHTLSDAVRDGILGEDVAFCGLSPQDVERLAVRYGEKVVLVRLRSAQADGRTRMSIAEFARWTRSEEVLLVDGHRWQSRDVRDVFPARLDEDLLADA